MIREYRATILLSAGLFILMFAVAYLNSEAEKGEGHPSSYSALQRGAKATYLLLQQSGYPVERWQKPPKELPQRGDRIILVLAEPESYANSEEFAALSHFLSGGGTVLAAGFFPDSFVPEAAATLGDRRVGGVECSPVAPTRLTRNGSITQDGSLYWDSTDTSQMVHFADDKGNAVVVSYPVGKGEVIWWASAWPLENAGIREKHNLEFVLDSVHGFKRILWDEYYHGQRQHSASHQPFRVYKWAFGQLAIISLAVLLTFSRRSGPLIPSTNESRLSPLEFVDTLGNVFSRAKSAQVAVEIAFQRLRQIAARRLGIRGTSTAPEIVEAIAHSGISLPPAIAQLISTSEAAACEPSLTEKAALEYIRALNSTIELLDPAITGAKERK